MKRAAGILAVVILTAVYTWLATTKYLAEERSARLERELAAAEARVVQLGQELDSASTRVTGLGRKEAESQATHGVFTREAVATPPAASAPESLFEKITISSGSENAVASVPVAPVVLGPSIRYLPAPGPGSVVRVEGTSNIHDWQAESRVIGGSAELPAGFPGPLESELKQGTVPASVHVYFSTSSLRSVDTAGRPYSELMDNRMHEALGNSRIEFELVSLRRMNNTNQFKGGSEAGLFADYSATGRLVVAGVTNNVSMPVYVLIGSEGRLGFAGNVETKMSNFRIKPPSPAFGSSLIQTGDDIKLIFVWEVKPSTSLRAAK